MDKNFLALNNDQLDQQVAQWISEDKMRAHALCLCAYLFEQQGIRDWYIAAGFVRNLIWDKLHQIEHSPLNDIDVIYYQNTQTDAQQDKLFEQDLKRRITLPFSVKNQARMHSRNGDKPYQSCIDAMKWWPEKQTAVAVKLSDIDTDYVHRIWHSTTPHFEDVSPMLLSNITVKAAFGLRCLFDYSLTHNPKRSHQLFIQRVNSKGWLDRYPMLHIK
ncbi:nucleotidyltransferase family protein [Shewanella maritima]|uniref:nucleotidyltransferase family protein n=1 Tax=Shewanella maritima TaxID=2520507 RepID=UPI003735D496